MELTEETTSTWQETALPKGSGGSRLIDFSFADSPPALSKPEFKVLLLLTSDSF